MYCKEHEVLTQSVSSTEDLPDVRGSAVIQYPEQVGFFVLYQIYKIPL